MSRETVEIEVQYLGATPAAIRVRDEDEEGAEEVWLPKSQVDYDSDASVGDFIKVEVPEWLAVEKGLV